MAGVGWPPNRDDAVEVTRKRATVVAVRKIAIPSRTRHRIVIWHPGAGAEQETED
jgi:hypothetical protein